MSTEDKTPHFGLRSYAAFVLEYFKANLAMEMEYRVSFLGKVAGMIVNDAMWLTFWLLYFARFPAVRGWQRADIITLWAIDALGFGICHCLFGNISNLAPMIARGDLDFYLGYPRHALIHMAVSRTNTTAVGDVLFGISVFFIGVRPTLVQACLFLAGGVLVATLFFGFTVISHSLSFYIGNSERLSEQAASTLIHFATYPMDIFGGATKVVLFTLIPAGFINSIPVRVVREFDPLFFGCLILVAILFAAAADRIFKAGLRRYESGNLLQVRM